jgi:predicted RNA-binding Zn-ribbon protein involved in translation (DUF1610 family)
MSDAPTPGQIAYAAYVAALRPSVVRYLEGLYAHLRPEEHRAWEAAAQAVLTMRREEQEAWHVYCGGCGVIVPAREEVEDDVCPRCGRHSVLSPRFQGKDHTHYAPQEPMP